MKTNSSKLAVGFGCFCIMALFERIGHMELSAIMFGMIGFFLIAMECFNSVLK